MCVRLRRVERCLPSTAPDHSRHRLNPQRAHETLVYKCARASPELAGIGLCSESSRCVQSLARVTRRATTVGLVELPELLQPDPERRRGDATAPGRVAAT